MRPITVQVGPLAAPSANNIAASQSPGAGAIALNGTTVAGGVATLDAPRRVIFTSGGNDSGINFTITGTNWSGQPISETLAGGNATAAQTVLDYKTVTGVTHTGSIATTLTIGTNGVASSPWVRLDDFGFAPVDLQVDVSGTINWTVEQSDDDPNNLPPLPTITPAAMTWITPDATNLSAKTATARDSLPTTPAWLRLTANSQTNPGFAAMTVRQPGGQGG